MVKGKGLATHVAVCKRAPLPKAHPNCSKLSANTPNPAQTPTTSKPQSILTLIAPNSSHLSPRTGAQGGGQRHGGTAAQAGGGQGHQVGGQVPGGGGEGVTPLGCMGRGGLHSLGGGISWPSKSRGMHCMCCASPVSHEQRCRAVHADSPAQIPPNSQPLACLLANQPSPKTSIQILILTANFKPYYYLNYSLIFYSHPNPNCNAASLPPTALRRISSTWSGLMPAWRPTPPAARAPLPEAA